ncbi:tRNA pseudouridine(55) synthase TruB [bacterium]|nr:tRNA pseudouridine(55) synthase TruB [bacterium]
MSLILVDKPEGPTSHNVVAAVKRALKADKVGHLGTLDPFASGLLPILIGNTARLADEAMDGQKGYLFTIGFGAETDTLDPTGRVIAQAPLPDDLSNPAIERVLSAFRGPIEQVPPVYSALKMNGMPLYEHMRATGKLPVDIESKRRQVNIHALEVIHVDNKSLELRVVCSKGTYVRSLARDIAKALGSVGTCIKLRRELVEPWNVNDALKFATDAAGRIATPDLDALRHALLPPWAVAPKLPRAILPEQHAARFNSGNPLIVPAGELSWLSNENPTTDASQSEVRQNIATELHALSDEIARASATKTIFVSCESVLFLCECEWLNNELKLQPRKRISG